MSWLNFANRRFVRFRQLSGGERRLLCQALLLLPVTRLLLKAIGFRRAQRALALLAPAILPVPSAEQQRRACSTARLVALAARYGPCRANCLARSLVSVCLLRRQGIAGDLRIGVRKVSHAFAAHAWVELDGKAIDSREDLNRQFLPFDGAIQPQMQRW